MLIPRPDIPTGNDGALPERLARHLDEWLGIWRPPGEGEIIVVGSDKRTTPGWDGAVRPFVGVETLSGAVLSGADLAGADLCGADLCGAVLRYADLAGAVLSGTCVELLLADDGRGYQVVAHRGLLSDGEPVYLAGCRQLTYHGAVAHWSAPDHANPESAARILAAIEAHHTTTTEGSAR